MEDKIHKHMIKKGRCVFVILGFFVLAGILFNMNLVSSVGDSIEIDSILIKVSVKEEGYIEKSFNVRGLEECAVTLDAIGIMGVELSEKDFFMNEGEIKEIVISFNSSGLIPGAYVGYISLNDEKTSLKLPVLLEVESEDVFFDSNLEIPPLYTDVSPGSKVLAQIKIFDLTAGTQDGLGPVSVEMSYYIYNTDGTPIISETESIVVSEDTSITKSITLPKKIEKGNYFIIAVTKYGSSVGVSSGVFSVSSGGINWNFGRLNFSWGIALFAVLIFIGLFMLFFTYLLRDRDKFLLSLKRYHDQELQRQKEFLTQQQITLRGRKGISMPQVRREIKTKVTALKEKQKERVKEFKKLKKKGRVSTMEKKLKDWKKKGYNTLLMESKLEGLSTGEMKGIMNKWKKQGYTSPKNRSV